MEQIQFVCAFLSFQSTPQNPPNKRLLVCKEFSTFLEKADIFLLYKGPFCKFPLITGFSWAMIGTVDNSSTALVGMWAGELQLRIFKKTAEMFRCIHIYSTVYTVSDQQCINTIPPTVNSVLL